MKTHYYANTSLHIGNYGRRKKTLTTISFACERLWITVYSALTSEQAVSQKLNLESLDLKF